MENIKADTPRIRSETMEKIMINSTLEAVPDLQAILHAWIPFKEQIGVITVHTQADYRVIRRNTG
jgi:hypothetical protein